MYLGQDLRNQTRRSDGSWRGWVRCCPMPTTELADEWLHTWVPHHLKFYIHHQSIRMAASSFPPSKFAPISPVTKYNLEIQEFFIKQFLNKRIKMLLIKFFWKIMVMKIRWWTYQNIRSTFKAIFKAKCIALKIIAIKVKT